MATTTSKRKKAVAATVAAAALLLAGTFAWTSISQQALNESAGIVNVGGRLHDDFDGTNKDVYVENFTDPLNGGQPIYARVRLDEYMEVGQDAGGVDDGDNIDEVVTILDGTVRTDETTWQTHVPSASCAVCAAEGSGCVIHDCWEWTMGGDTGGSADGQTTYMPTFNKDKDSLASDRNGTYQGTDKDDKVYYDDYVTYVTEGGETITLSGNYTQPEGAETANELTEANKAITKVTGTALYDDDTDTFDNDGTRSVTETHTAKKTATADVVLMADWLADGGKAGNFWVYDEDGWAYWANPIMPGEATGLLLDGIKMKQNPGEKCYYGINVVAQFATVGDWEYFENKDGSKGLPEDSDAMRVMTAASEAVATMNINILETPNVSTYIYGEKVAFDAKVTVKGTEVADPGTITYRLMDADKYESKMEGNVLTIGNDAKNTVLTIVAEAENYPGVVAMKSITCGAQPTVSVLYDGKETLPMILERGKQIQLAISISDERGIFDNATIAYRSANSNATVSDEGLVTIGTDIEPDAQIQIIATITSADGKSSMETICIDQEAFVARDGNIANSEGDGSLSVSSPYAAVDEENHIIYIVATEEADDSIIVEIDTENGAGHRLYKDGEIIDYRDNTYLKYDIGNLLLYLDESVEGNYDFGFAGKFDTDTHYAFEFEVKVF